MARNRAMNSSRITSFRRAIRAGLISTALLPIPTTATLATPTNPVSQNQAAACGAICAKTQTLDVGGIDYAYRSLGAPSGTPLILLNRFRGTMDEWDPEFLDYVATRRQVIIFDNVGVARSGGEAPAHMNDWAKNAAAFIDRLGFNQVDLLGFSFGGLVAQELTLQRPDLVRKLIIVGSGAGYVEGANLSAKAIEVATRPTNSDEDFLYLFFKDTPTSQAAGRAHLARLRERKDAFAKLVSEKAWKAMLSAGSDVGTAETSLLNRVGSIRQPVLVANGNEDAMIPTFQSYALAQAIPNARLIIYPDSGHAFLFQYPREFGDEVISFLGDEARP
ncbi:MAG: alpha/beta hydrolase [Mesorhizobium sp.]|nr:MAG: alpha/beta hydrolase [Mesorhizobium sp.]RWC66092.1 MAG: alpha/beta hydrolase [Mesorhizobium sp.]